MRDDRTSNISDDQRGTTGLRIYPSPVQGGDAKAKAEAHNGQGAGEGLERPGKRGRKCGNAAQRQSPLDYNVKCWRCKAVTNRLLILREQDYSYRCAGCNTWNCIESARKRAEGLSLRPTMGELTKSVPKQEPNDMKKTLHSMFVERRTSPADLVKRCKLAKQTASDILSGKKTVISRRTVDKIYDGLGIRVPDEFITARGPKSKPMKKWSKAVKSKANRSRAMKKSWKNRAAKQEAPLQGKRDLPPTYILLAVYADTPEFVVVNTKTNTIYDNVREAK